MQIVIGNKNYSSWSMRPVGAGARGRHSVRRSAAQVRRVERRVESRRHRALWGRRGRCRCSSSTASRCGIRSPSARRSPSAFRRSSSGLRCARATGGALHLRRDAFRLPGAARRHADEYSLEPSGQGHECQFAPRHRPRGRHLEVLPRALRQGRAFAVRSLSRSPTPISHRW